MTETVQAYIDPLAVGLTADRFLLATGWMYSEIQLDPNQSDTAGWLVRIQCGQFRFGVAVARQHVVIYRGEVQLGVAILDVRHFAYKLRWNPERIELAVEDLFGERSNGTDTPYTRPPTALLKWARAQAILPPIEPYANAQAVVQEVVMQLRSIEQKLAAGAWVAFWDGGKPRPERQVNSILHSYFVDTLECAKGIQVYPEHPSGSGRMDFLFVAHLASGERVEVCAEFKLAHSAELAHGLERQLADYMESKRTEYGIFGVVDFGAPYVPVAEFANWRADPDHRDVQTEVSMAATKRKIAPVVISVSKPKPPSDR